MIFSINSSLFWLLLGIALMVVELVLPGFVIVFFGIGAVITAVVSYLGVENLVAQIIIFLASSMISLLLFRNRFAGSFKGDVARTFQKGESLDNLIGKKALVKEDIIPSKLKGRVEFNGTLWDVECDEEVMKGEVVEIIERKNLKLKVKKA